MKERTFIRKHIVTKDGRILLPFQHYIGPDDQKKLPPLDRDFTNPRNGVLISRDGGQKWTEHGNIRLTPQSRYFGWAENDLFEHPDGRITMIIRADSLGGMLYKSREQRWRRGASVQKASRIGHAAPELRSKLFFPALTAQCAAIRAPKSLPSGSAPPAKPPWPSSSPSSTNWSAPPSLSSHPRPTTTPNHTLSASPLNHSP